MIKFLHAADLHIDSPLRGLDAYEGAPVERLRTATRTAFRNLVELAIEQEVQLVLLAGDLFDGRWLDAATGVWTASQLRRLVRNDTQVILLRGNHDALSQIPDTLRWPPGVIELSVERPQTVVLEELGLAVHGQGFARREATDDLAAQYPAAIDGLFNIGMLHTSLTGDPQHDSYAPTSEATLLAKGYDYWALGHIHQHRVIRERPYIAYCGNTQGRHIREVGPKGCLLAEVEGRELISVTFHATDCLRWGRLQLELQTDDSLDELFGRVEQAFAEQAQAAEGRYLALRVAVTGACHAHRHLARTAQQLQASAEIRRLAADRGDLWVEKIVWETRPPVDRQQMQRGGHLLGDLLGLVDEIQADDQALSELAEAAFKPLAGKAAVELEDADVDLQDPEALRRWLRQAEALLVARLWEADA